ncbi:MAG: outer membrane beta-barrel family protein [Bacteroidia bacterium]|nr:outer membrane beta-barrel family protein [Bacteroidia bacterium]
MKKHLLIILLIASNVLILNGQNRNSGTISGTIIDKQAKKPIEFATIVIQKKNDDTVIDGTVTDSKGKFIFENIAYGEYIISYSFIGYAKKSSPPFIIDAQHKSVNLGELFLELSVQELNSVEVVGEKSTFTSSIDRKTFNIGKDIMTTSGTASELMQHIPSLQVDIEGNVSLRGSGNVLILINGRPSSLMGANRAAVLQQMPANTIDKIEVITNPSAKYKPDGTSGIINIILKKNKDLGFNGSVIANVGNAWRSNASLTTNYNSGRFNIFGSYSIRQDERHRLTNDFRQRKDSISNILSTTKQTVSDLSRPLSHIVRTGVDFNLNEKNSFGVSGSYNYRSFVRHEINSNLISDGEGITTMDYDRSRRDPEYEKDLEFTATYQHVFAKDHELNIEYTTSNSAEQEDNHYSTIYRVPVSPVTLDNTLIHQGDRESQLYIEYKNPISDNTKFETGYVLESVLSDGNFFAESFNTSTGSWVKDLQKSNRFKYIQNVHALYATLEHTMGKFGFLAGLRAEQAFVKSHLITTDTIIPNDYFRLYPTLHLAYNVNENNEFQLNYSHRVNRPEGDELNPFPEYADPLNLRAGNPHLKPEDIHSFEAGYSYKHNLTTFIATIYDRYTYNGKTEITRYINDSILFTTRENLSKSNSAGLELILSSEIGKSTIVNLSSNTYYYRIDASSLGYSSNKSNFVWNVNLNTNTKITRTTVIQVNSNYNSTRLTPQGKIFPTFIVNMGIRQDLWNRKASLILTVSDVFNTFRNNSELNTPLLYDKTIRRRSPRIIYAGFVFNFGKSNNKQKEEQLKFENQ